MILAGTILVFRSLRQRQGLHRRQAIALIISVLAPWAGNIFIFPGITRFPYLDLTPFAFMITVSVLTWAILGFRLVDLSPIARDLIVDKMKDGMIVIDAQGKVVDINPAAERSSVSPVPDDWEPLALSLLPGPNLSNATGR